QVDRLSARLEERDDPVRAALPGTIQHWNLNLNPPHTRNSGYLLGARVIESPPLQTPPQKRKNLAQHPITSSKNPTPPEITLLPSTRATRRGSF
ncbi:hypothetical protein, partial [Burkholderia multivorans]|uniref:hypothetical protein n=1 Tax=Burkholderia multivorans TaxID=87883 RepID=UPI002666437A